MPPSDAGIDPGLRAPFVDLLLALADDKLLRGHLNSDWTGLAPILEEDIAFSSLAQDDLAHAQAVYELAAPLQTALAGAVTHADALAFGRRADAFRSARIVEIPDEFDWATALARQLFTSHFDALRLERMSRSNARDLAELAARLLAEQRIHVAHADDWFARLGRGTDEARDRLQSALDALAPHAVMLFESVERQDELERAGVYPLVDGTGFEPWRTALTRVIESARLRVRLEAPDPSVRGGRRGAHDARLPEILAEMSEVFAIAPDAAW